MVRFPYFSSESVEFSLKNIATFVTIFALWSVLRFSPYPTGQANGADHIHCSNHIWFHASLYPASGFQISIHRKVRPVPAMILEHCGLSILHQ